MGRKKVFSPSSQPPYYMVVLKQHPSKCLNHTGYTNTARRLGPNPHQHKSVLH